MTACAMENAILSDYIQYIPLYYIQFVITDISMYMNITCDNILFVCNNDNKGQYLA